MGNSKHFIENSRKKRMGGNQQEFQGKKSILSLPATK